MEDYLLIRKVLPMFLCGALTGLSLGAERTARPWDVSLDGTWTVESFEWNRIRRKDFENGKFLFLDGVICWAVPGNGEVSMGAYSAITDERSVPHQITLVHYETKEQLLGIYAQRGNVLVICYGKKRPGQFATTSSRFRTQPSGTPRLLTLRRVPGVLDTDTSTNEAKGP